MEPPMSNGSMHHREPKSEIDDTGQILQGASCTIACALHMPTETRVQVPRYSLVEVLVASEKRQIFAR
jgi:hypothetical protein